MKSHKFKTKMSKLWILITVFCSFVLTIAYPTYAFFRANTERQVEPTLEIEVLFGRLREDLVSGEWGTEYNPYLIMTTEHLSNMRYNVKHPLTYFTIIHIFAPEL